MMIYRPYRAALVAAVFLLAVPATSAVAGLPATIGARELRPGMRGYGLSVFFGQQVDSFEAEVIDVIENEWPRGDLILCRLSGQGLEESGIVAGMSGSPVFFEGRLAGAVAYGWGFAKEPIAGVTPIRQMLEIWRDEERPGRTGLRTGSSNSLTGDDRRLSALRPLTVPLAVSGLGPVAAGVIDSLLGGWGLVSVVAGSGRGIDSSDAALLPGSAIGVALVDGDLRFSAIGTLTARDGDRVLIFGHPMFQAGSVELPLVTGRIHTVLPNALSSFKIFSPGPVVGAVTEDRLHGVAARLGWRAPTLPVSVRLMSPTADESFSLRLARHDELVPTLLPAALAGLVYESEGTMAEATVEALVRLYLHGESVLIRHVAAGIDPTRQWLFRLRNELLTVFGNRFERPSLDSVTVNLVFSAGAQRAWLEGVRPARQLVRPGERVQLYLRLRDWRGESREDSIEVDLPSGLPDGPLVLRIGQRDSLLLDEQLRAPERLEPQSLRTALELLAQAGREDELALVGMLRSGGMVLGRGELAALPRSLRSVLAPGSAAGRGQLTSESRVLDVTVPMGRVIAGTARVELEVRR